MPKGHVDKYAKSTPGRTTGCTDQKHTVSAMNGILTILDREWDQISTSPAARRSARRWATADPTLDSTSPGDLVNRLRTGPSHHDAQVAVNALARLAAQGDALAARTALQIVLPLIFYRTMRAMSAVGYAQQLQADAHAEAVAAAVDRIHRLPSQPTPTPLWSIERAVRSRLSIWLRQHHNRLDLATDPNEIPEPIPAHADTDPSPGQQLLIIIGEAVRDGRITVDDANLVVHTRIAGLTFEDMARTGDRRPLTYSRHRRRAEKALIASTLATAS